MKIFLTTGFIILALILRTHGQQVSGAVTECSGAPVPGANVYIENTYDGSSTDENGRFSFITGLRGQQMLAVSCIGFALFRKTVALDGSPLDLEIRLEEAVGLMDGVTIAAGAFDISETSRATMLRPYDIATTPGATADIAGAMNTLPGSANIGEDGRLFVRGGDGHETRSFIDGMLINSFYEKQPEGIPARARFSPFLFRGQYFSSGGYSAEYGDALSSTLVLNTIDMPARTQTDLSLMGIGASVSHTQKWDNKAVFAEMSFSDLEPYFHLVRQKINWLNAPVSWSATLNYRQRTEKSLLKLYYQGSVNRMSLEYDSPFDIPNRSRVDLGNGFHYMNANFRVQSGKWIIFSGLSATANADQEEIGKTEIIDEKSRTFHVKTCAVGGIHERINIKLGGEAVLEENSFQYEDSGVHFTRSIARLDPALFLEPELDLSRFALRAGIRYERLGSPRIDLWSPRLSVAYKTGDHSQLSAAYGWFFQEPLMEYLRYNNRLRHEKAIHYIVNWQWVREGRSFRIEAFSKDYSMLVKYDRDAMHIPAGYNNQGYGYARGVDVFWRDTETLSNLEYWISLSLLESERDFRDYPYAAPIGFAPARKLSVVWKYWFEHLRSQVGASYTFQSGRHYHNPNREGFYAEKTGAFHDLSLNWSYVARPNLIVHVMVNNAPGFDPVFTYEYSTLPDENGLYQGMAVKRPAKRFFFLGVFLTLSKDKSANQLNNL